MPALGISLFLIAIGAILMWAVNVSFGAIDIHVVGGILFAVGLLGTVLAMLFWTSWAPFASRDVHEDVHLH